MYLQDLHRVGQFYKYKDLKGWDLPEIQFDEETKELLRNFKENCEINSYGITSIEKDKNVCWTPSQHLLMALKVKPFALLLLKYFDTLEKIISDNDDQLLYDVFMKNALDDKVTHDLDKMSWNRLKKFVMNKDERLGGKNMFISKGISFRPSRENYSSIINKTLPTYDAGFIGAFIYDVIKSSNLDTIWKKYRFHFEDLVQWPSEEEAIYQIFMYMEIHGLISPLINRGTREGEFVTVGGIPQLFKISQREIPGHTSYLQDSIAGLEGEERGYVHVRKDLLSDPKNEVLLTELLSSEMNLKIYRGDGSYILKNICPVGQKPSQINIGLNKIFYGAPGTGKSHRVNELSQDGQRFRTVFHRETQYSDFVGTLKPSMKESRVQYSFQPGPFTKAYIHALKHPHEKVYLIVEEINRAPAAAVFGELFQVLDRRENGESTYSVSLTDISMVEYLKEALTFDKDLTLPSNLCILATMNSSDQAVMTMDTAFKRRWQFEYLPIDTAQASSGMLRIPCSSGNMVPVPWSEFLDIINTELMELNIPEDRLLGHRFLSDAELKSADGKATIGKVLIYLWDDVLRQRSRHQIFTQKVSWDGKDRQLSTFGLLMEAYEKGKCIFCKKIDDHFLSFQHRHDHEDEDGIDINHTQLTISGQESEPTEPIVQ